MEKRSQTLHASLVVFSAALLFIPIGDCNSIYYLTPDSSSTSGCARNQSCQTFGDFTRSHYCTEENLTMVFLKGHHILSKNDTPFRMCNRYVAMVGILSADIIVYNMEVTFVKVLELWIQNMILRNGHFQMLPGSTQANLISVTFIDHTLFIREIDQTRLHDCKFSSGKNPLITESSKILLSGNSTFFNNLNSAITLYKSTIVLSGTVSFVNNTGVRGGAMNLYSSNIFVTTGLNVSFINNSAEETGGAIHIEPDMTRNPCPECFYKLRGYSTDIAFYYSNNLAQFGGDNIYGTSLALCAHLKRIFGISNHFSSNVRRSSVSSDPTRVCLCDSDGQLQCKNASHSLTKRNVHPGETFTIPAAVVGGDYGTTIGTVHTRFVSTANHSSVPALATSHQYRQWVSDIYACTDLQYTIYSRDIDQSYAMYLTVQLFTPLEPTSNKYATCGINRYSYNSDTPTISLTILPCPLGLSLLQNPSRCVCNPVLTSEEVKCKIMNGTAYFSWNSTLWIGINTNGIKYAKHCPLNYCETTRKQMKLIQEPSAQCAFNRAGRLCGGCREGYSLVIGSSHCIKCPNNNGLALTIFFAAAGFLLVFFINVLNITLTQGLINGLIFYANVIWTYWSVFLPRKQDFNVALIFFKTFIAWLNLDFGIETCFVKGLTAYWKIWLQFVFPFYIWVIVGLMILSARHSKTLTKIYGNKTVPVLATLFLLSYMKLLRAVTSIYMLSDVFLYPERSVLKVWSIDGNVDYFGPPHAILFVAAFTVQLFLWLPYTLTLLCEQLLQKVSHLTIFKWVTKLKPYIDAHFAPFKPAHRYWFGILLLARGVLLIIFSSSYATPKNTNLLLLLTIILILLLYMAIVQPYKSRRILVFQSSFFVNILFLGMFTAYAQMHNNQHTLQTAAASISIGVAFFQFCGIVIHNAVGLCHCKRNNTHGESTLQGEEQKLEKDFSINYRDSIISDSL